MGVARAASPGLYLYEDGTTVLQFTVISRGRIRIKPVGMGYKSHCGMYGTIENAVYVR
jgi:hypothetical protein